MVKLPPFADEREAQRCTVVGKIKQRELQKWVLPLRPCLGQKVGKGQNPAVPLFHVRSCES